MVKKENNRVEKCPYCGSSVELKDSSIVYKRSYGLIYICSRYPECDAYVGCHGDTDVPLGTMANLELRELRKRAHNLFDKKWKSGRLTRKAAYRRLQVMMGLGKKDAHIAKFNIDQCRKVIEIFSGEKNE